MDCAFQELNGFSVIHIHRDRPPKLKFGNGSRFFSNEKFGCLVSLARDITQGASIDEACETSGVKLHRAKRFLKAIKIPFSHEKQIKEKTCDVCGSIMRVSTLRQKRHDGECKKKWTNDYYKGYVRKCRTKP